MWSTFKTMKPSDLQLQILRYARATGTAWPAGTGKDPEYRQAVVRLKALGWLQPGSENGLTPDGARVVEREDASDSAKLAIRILADFDLSTTWRGPLGEWLASRAGDPEISARTVTIALLAGLPVNLRDTSGAEPVRLTIIRDSSRKGR